jgi:hypothetical protein
MIRFLDTALALLLAASLSKKLKLSSGAFFWDTRRAQILARTTLMIVDNVGCSRGVYNLSPTNESVFLLCVTAERPGLPFLHTRVNCAHQRMYRRK